MNNLNTMLCVRLLTSRQVEVVVGAKSGERVGRLVVWTAGRVDWTPQSRALR